MALLSSNLMANSTAPKVTSSEPSTSSSSATAKKDNKTSTPPKKYPVLYQFRKFQEFLALSILLIYAVDLMCIIHRDGGWNNSAVRHHYHKLLKKNIPQIPGLDLGHNGVQVNRKGEEVEDEIDAYAAIDVCEYAEIASRARTNARYNSLSNKSGL